MPSRIDTNPRRSDIFANVEKVLKAAGIVTVWRGAFKPSDHGDFPATVYPLAALIDSPGGERVESGNVGTRHLGEYHAWIWVATGEDLGAMAQNPTAQKTLDDIHDAIVDVISDSYPKIHSQTIGLKMADGEAWVPFWWYTESAHIGAALGFTYALNYAPHKVIDG
jgi:hypothetical protein